MTPREPTFADVQAAAHRIADQAVRTPVIESPALNRRVGGRVLIKAENLQRTGSFKFRGAWNMIAQLDGDRAIVAYSSGNHAQGVAAAAELKGLPAVIVMPGDAPAVKMRNTRAYGAEIVTYDRAREAREEIAARLAGERNAVIVPPYEHPDIIGGQGTAAVELIEEAAARGVQLADMLVAASGGGLAAGTALAFEALSPATRIHIVEPEGFDDHGRSLRSGQRERNVETTGSICDALMAAEPGRLTFSINRTRVADGLAVSDAEARRAVAYAFEVLKLVLEPGGAVTLAAVLAGRLTPRGGAVGLIASGGNIDADLFAEIVSAPA